MLAFLRSIVDTIFGNVFGKLMELGSAGEKVMIG